MFVVWVVKSTVVPESVMKKAPCSLLSKATLVNQPKIGDRDGEGDRLSTGRVVRRGAGLAEADATVRPGQIAHLLGAGEIGDVVAGGDGDGLAADVEGRGREVAAVTRNPIGR